MDQKLERAMEIISQADEIMESEGITEAVKALRCDV